MGGSGSGVGCADVDDVKGGGRKGSTIGQLILRFFVASAEYGHFFGVDEVGASERGFLAVGSIRN